MKKILLKANSDQDPRKLEQKLLDFGYQKNQSQSLEFGEYSFLGDTIKIFPVNEAEIFLISFFGNTIETIKKVDSRNNKAIVESMTFYENRVKLVDKAIISPGDYVVHIDHGIGVFSRLGVKTVLGEKTLYVYIEYLNNSFLYVPIDQIERLTKYIGASSRKPKLSSLGSSTWKKRYQAVYEDIRKLAKDLLDVYAKRSFAQKDPRTIEKNWDKELETTFGFKKTDDQENAILNVYQDLQKNHPFDSLVCGDVGFGKTEVAIRAAAQTIANGYQVAMLVPTTILAEQHFSTMTKRFINLPVKIARLSRFVKEAEAKSIISSIKDHKTDFLIATHQLIRSDISFSNLGLLIIDEEQKFGVKDKEYLKKIRQNIDVLTLTATPIPRTLFMSLSGLRDISVIAEPPQGRKSIKTKVMEFNKETIIEAINQEVARGGQVYYLHNRVETIEGVRSWLKKALPNLRIEVAHGQMSEDRLSQTMTSFAEENIDLLVCSTIIENGLDLPNVNTLIVDEADRFGLSQLYQIRGRIGRSKKQAYSYFFYSHKKLTNNATKRLKALIKSSELGSGYNLALRDLEIRGGGNLLGKQQHGNMETVGLVLYSKMLERAVNSLKES